MTAPYGIQITQINDGSALVEWSSSEESARYGYRYCLNGGEYISEIETGATAFSVPNFCCDDSISVQIVTYADSACSDIASCSLYSRPHSGGCLSNLYTCSNCGGTDLDAIRLTAATAIATCVATGNNTTIPIANIFDTVFGTNLSVTTVLGLDECIASCYEYALENDSIIFKYGDEILESLTAVDANVDLLSRFATYDSSGAWTLRDLGGGLIGYSYCDCRAMLPEDWRPEIYMTICRACGRSVQVVD